MDYFTNDFNAMLKITILNSLGFFFLDFLIPFVASVELKVSGFQMGIIFSIRTIGYLLLAPIAGSLTDKISNVILIMIGSIGRGLAYFLLYFSIATSSFVMMVVGNFLLGSMAGFYWIPFDNLIAKKSRAENRSEAYGKRQLIMGQGIMIGTIIGFTIMNTVNGFGIDNNYLLYSALVIYGISNILGGILFYIKVDESITIDTVKAENQSYISFLKNMDSKLLIGFLILLVVIFLSSSNTNMAKPFIIVFLTKNIESDPSIASFAFLPAGISSMLLAPKLGKLVDRLNIKLVIISSAILGGITTWFLINTDSIILFSILLVIDTTIATGTGLVIQSVFSKISQKNRGKVFGLATIFGDLGAIIGPVIGGILWDKYSYKSPFIASIIVELLLVPFFVFAITRLKPFIKEKINT